MSAGKRFSLIFPLMRILLSLGLLLATGAGQAIERVTYYHNDALGSPVAATDANGTLLWRESYAPYGERLTREASGNDTVWYTGKPEEAAFGLNYFGARWYDPKIGRFMGVDPAGFSADNIQSFNRYAYANNNPYLYVDPDGKEVRFIGEPKALSVLKKAYDTVRGTEHGEKLCKTIEESKEIYTITGDNPQAYFDPMDITINVDPDFHPNVQTTDGVQPATTEIILGHEIGHAATGTRDTGPGNMANVKQNENPIRRELKYPARTAY